MDNFTIAIEKERRPTMILVGVCDEEYSEDSDSDDDVYNAEDESSDTETEPDNDDDVGARLKHIVELERM